MERLVLFCKSYGRDMLRARRLAESVQRFNPEELPFWLSVPAAELLLFQECFGSLPVHFLTDEEILAQTALVYGPLPGDFPHHLLQQLIKLEFWRMNLTKNYLWLDSDSYFIRPFGTRDFLSEDERPYTVLHEEEEYFAAAERLGLDRVKRDFLAMTAQFKGWFSRSGPDYSFGPSPLVWSVHVLESLYRDYLAVRGETIYALLRQYPSEIMLYGEYLLARQVIPLHAHKPFFRVYHTLETFLDDQEKGAWEGSLARNHLGIVLQSNWSRPMRRKTGVQGFLKNLLGSGKS